MLSYLMKARGRRQLFRLLWRENAAGSVSALARRGKLAFSTAYRELEGLRAAGLAVVERTGTELVYRADLDHPEGELLRRLATLSEVSRKPQRAADAEVRTWLANVGAPVGSPDPTKSTPPVETVLASALALSHRDPTVARVCPLMLWRHRKQMDMGRLKLEATRLDEKQTLGYFLELAATFGGDTSLRKTARKLNDRRRTRSRMFFAGQHGPLELAQTRRNTPKEATKWGYLMNMSVDSFRSTFEKFSSQ
jgi:hypothetical protein